MMLDIFVFVKWYCDTSELCQKFKSSGTTREPLQCIVVNRPWQIVGIDFTGPFNRTRGGVTYIVIAIDYFTKFIEAWALDDCKAIKTARFLFDEIICRYGMMEKLLGDQGRNFEAALIAE
jgi:hypothetical protein